MALDVSSEGKLINLVNELSGKVGMFKIGKEMFSSLGPRAVELVRKKGGEVFLDLKYHDIPNTVAGAVKAAARLGVAMLTVHGAGGRKMLEAACSAADEAEEKPAIIAVTVLTSLGRKDLQDLGISATPKDLVHSIGALAIEAGVDGLVASPLEVKSLREKLGKGPVLVTPGVRPAGTASQDQTRVATPIDAVKAGSDFLVIGRPITKAKDPGTAAMEIAKSIDG